MFIFNSCLRRRLCLQRWSFCNFAVMGTDGVNHSWKRYFLRRSHLEMTMSKGRSGSYTCKSLRGHTGELLRGAAPEPEQEFTNIQDITSLNTFSFRQGGGVGVPAGQLSSASSSLEHQCHSLQCLD